MEKQHLLYIPGRGHIVFFLILFKFVFDPWVIKFLFDPDYFFFDPAPPPLPQFTHVSSCAGSAAVLVSFAAPAGALQAHLRGPARRGACCLQNAGRGQVRRAAMSVLASPLHYPHSLRENKCVFCNALEDARSLRFRLDAS